VQITDGRWNATNVERNSLAGISSLPLNSMLIVVAISCTVTLTATDINSRNCTLQVPISRTTLPL
jgi:hypothetical protein